MKQAIHHPLATEQIRIAHRGLLFVLGRLQRRSRSASLGLVRRPLFLCWARKQVAPLRSPDARQSAGSATTYVAHHHNVSLHLAADLFDNRLRTWRSMATTATRLNSPQREQSVNARRHHARSDGRTIRLDKAHTMGPSKHRIGTVSDTPPQAMRYQGSGQSLGSALRSSSEPQPTRSLGRISVKDETLPVFASKAGRAALPHRPARRLPAAMLIPTETALAWQRSLRTSKFPVPPQAQPAIVADSKYDHAALHTGTLLVWRKGRPGETRIETDNPPSLVHGTGMPGEPTSASAREIQPKGKPQPSQRAVATANPLLDATSVERLTEDVIRRIEQRMRIERERRGR